MGREPIIETIGVIGGIGVYIFAMAQSPIYGALIRDALIAF